MEAYEMLYNIRDVVSDKDILNELMYYMSTDELQEFTDHLIKVFDLDLRESKKAKIRKQLIESRSNVSIKQKLYDLFHNELEYLQGEYIDIKELKLRDMHNTSINCVEWDVADDVFYMYSDNPCENEDFTLAYFYGNSREKYQTLCRIYKYICQKYYIDEK